MDVSHVAVYGWSQKFGNEFLQMYMKYKEYSRHWYIDTNTTKLKGDEYHLLSIHDSNGVIISIRVSPKKSLSLV